VSERPTVLFVCVRNAGKSRMAAGLMQAALTRRGLPDAVAVTSAGTAPGGSVNALSAQSLRELGADIGGEPPTALTPAMVADATVVVTLGREAHVDPVPGPRFQAWDTDEPSTRGIEGIDRMRLVRDDIAARVEALLDDLVGQTRGS